MFLEVHIVRPEDVYIIYAMPWDSQICSVCQPACGSTDLAAAGNPCLAKLGLATPEKSRDISHPDTQSMVYKNLILHENTLNDLSVGI